MGRGICFYGGAISLGLQSYLRFEGGTGVGAIVGSSHTEPEEVRRSRCRVCPIVYHGFVFCFFQDTRPLAMFICRTSSSLPNYFNQVLSAKFSDEE